MDYEHSVIDQAHSEHELLWEDPLVTWELRELEAELLEVLPELL